MLTRGPQAAPAMQAGEIGARLDRLPATRSVWTLIALLSLGGFFEFYDLFFTGYVAPGLVREHILTPTTPGLFGTSGVAGFVASFFAGLFVGTLVFGFVADRFGRRTIFTISLLWYAAASAVMAFQTDADGLNLWRFITGIGVGVELVTIDTYLSELVPKQLRGRAFAVNQTIQFSVVPVVAFLAYMLVPLDPFGYSGWRYVVLIGSFSAVAVWFIRRAVPESPRWLAAHGRLAEADAIVTALEARVQAEHGRPLPPPGLAEAPQPRGNLLEAFRAPYLPRTLMLIVFNIFQTVGFYGFANWVPTLLIKQGITTTTSLGYTFIIACAAPFGPAACVRHRGQDRAEMADRDCRRVDCGVRPAVQPGQRRGRGDRVRRDADDLVQHHVLRLSRVPGGALPDAHPGGGGGFSSTRSAGFLSCSAPSSSPSSCAISARSASSPSSPAAW